MWLRRLVAIVMIPVCVGLNVLTLLGIVMPDKTKQLAAKEAQENAAALVSGGSSAGTAPMATLTLTPTSIAAGSSSALTWSTTGNPKECTASGSWSGPKTQFGSESTGRISKPGNYTFTLTCSNDAGKSTVEAVLTVGNAAPPPKTNTTTNTQTAAAPLKCGGRLPCYGPRDVAAHGSKGNCWGWNGNRVINISGFDSAYHIAKSGISSIETSQVCGRDLAPSINGQVAAGGTTRVHNQATKTNSDANEIPYFVGYYDASK